MTAPTYEVEAGFGATWVTPDASIVWKKLTDRVLDRRQPIRTQRGSTAAYGKADPTELHLLLKNTDRFLDPEHTASPYNGQLLPGVPIKFTVTPKGQASKVVARGFVTGFPQVADHADLLVVPITAYGIFDKLARASMPAVSVLDYEIQQLNPVGYWKMNGQPKSPIVADLQETNPRHDGMAEGDIGFGATALYAYGPDTAATFDGLNDRVDLDRGEIVDISVDSFTIVTVFKTSIPAEASSEHMIYFQQVGPQDASDTIQLYVHTDGLLTRIYTVGGGGFGRSTSMSVADGSPHIAFASNAADFGVSVDNATFETVSASASEQGGVGSAIGGPSYGNDIALPGFDDNYFPGVIAFVAIWDSGLTLAQRQTILDAYQAPLAGQTADQRITWITSRVGIPADRLALQVGQTHFGPAILHTVKSALDYLRLVEDSEDGRLYETSDGKIGFLDRYWPYTNSAAITSQMRFSDKPGFPAYAMVRRDKDDDLIVNVAVLSRQGTGTITVKNQTSIASFGEALEQRDNLLLADDNELRSLGQHLTTIKATPATRISKLRIPFHALPPAQQSKILNLDLGHRITFEHTPKDNTNKPVGSAVILDFVIEGIDGEWSATEAWVELNVAPAPAVQSFWILGTSALGSTTRLAY